MLARESVRVGLRKSGRNSARSFEIGAAHANQFEKSLGKLLRDRRVSCGLSQEQLALEIHVDAEQIKAYEAGVKHISTDHLLRIGQALAARSRHDVRPIKPPKPREAENNKGQIEVAVESPPTVEEEVDLLWAFASIKNAAVRKSLLDLVVELVKNENPR